jgi:hypothetical protein
LTLEPDEAPVTVADLLAARSALEAALRLRRRKILKTSGFENP